MIAFRTFCIVIALLACTCGIKGPSSLAGGSASEGEARVSGSVVDDASGIPVDNAIVRLRRADFLKDTTGASLTKYTTSSMDLATDSHGRFSIDSVDTGKFCIEVNNRHGKVVVFTCTIFSSDTLVDFAPDSVRPGSTIKGIISTRADGAAAVYVQVYGLERIAKRDPTTDSFSISDVPEGSYSLRIVSSSPLFSPSTMNPISIQPGTTNHLDTIRLLPFQDWAHSRKCVCNTTPSGADVAGAVYNFPVLIRLTNGNFIFSEAKIDGSDCRFTKSDHTPLPYEIERWDALQGMAEIWVKVDTVYGNDSTHFFTMYWGAPASATAASSSNGAAVFDTAHGFQGVWHLNDPVSGLVKDATLNGYNGTAVNVTAQTRIAAMVGAGRGFATGDSGYIVFPGTASGKLNFPENGAYAVSAWVWADSVDSAGHTFAAKGDQQYNLEMFEANWEFAEYKTTQAWEMTRSPAVAKTWAFVVGIRSQTTQYLFVNGQCVDSTVEIRNKAGTDRDTTHNVIFGKTVGVSETNFPYFFHGTLDEVRMLNVAPDANWIKLCYMNQKSQDALVQFK
jgi:hypothetical protein